MRSRNLRPECGHDGRFTVRVRWCFANQKKFARNLHFQIPRGSPDGQQVWECLTALIALRVWFVHGAPFQG